MHIPFDMEQVSIILFLIGSATLIIRSGTKQGWYILNMGKDRTFTVTQDTINFIDWWQSQKYVARLGDQILHALIWFFVTWGILLMALVGGSTIADHNPIYTIPCLILLVIMIFICLSKLILVISELIEEAIFIPFGIYIIKHISNKQPMSIRTSKDGHANLRKKSKIGVK